MSTTYWLWLGEECLASVLGDGLSERAVRQRAIEQHDRVPLCQGTGRNPYEHKRALAMAEIRIYDDRTGRRIK